MDNGLVSMSHVSKYIFFSFTDTRSSHLVVISYYNLLDHGTK